MSFLEYWHITLSVFRYAYAILQIMKKGQRSLCGRLVLSFIPKDVHSLICGICENVILQGKGELTDVIKLGSSAGKTILDYIRVPNRNKGSYEQNSERKSHC